MSSEEGLTEKEVVMVAVDDITPDPDQPRKTFNLDDIASMATTIESQGIINPIEIDENNVIVTGQIRWMAAKKAGLKVVPCIVWEGDIDEKFERQLVENLHHHQLPDRERESAIVKLWKTGAYSSRGVLAKAIGMSTPQVTQIIAAHTFREEHPELMVTTISTKAITDTMGLEDEQRVQILKSVEEEKIFAQDVRKLKRIAQVSDTLLEKTLKGGISLDRATETAESIRDIEEETHLTNAQKDRYVERIEKDEDTLRQYKNDVRERVKKVMTATPSERAALKTQAPAGRDSPVDKFTAVRDKVNNLMSYLGGCDADERAWVKRILIETREEIDKILEII